MSVIDKEIAEVVAAQMEGYGPQGDLEEQQYNELYQAMDVPLMDIRKKSFRAFTILCLILLGTLICFAAFIPIPNYVQVPIVIENTDQEHVMLLNHSARLNTYRVEVGDSVIAGQNICEVSSPQIQALISEIRVAENNIRSLDEHGHIDLDVQIRNLDAQITAKDAQIKALQAEETAAVSLYNSSREALESSIEYSRTLFEKDGYLYENEGISEVEFLRSKRALQDKEDELAMTDKAHAQTMQQFRIRLEELNETLVNLKNQQTELSSSFKTDRSRLEDQIAFARKNLELYYGPCEIEGDALMLRAPKSGKVTYRYPSHQLLQPGEILYRLEISKGSFEARGMIAANQIGYVRPTTEAKIMLETFPHYEWGSLPGRVDKISTSPNEVGEYSVSVSITKGNPRISPLLQNGQTGECSLIFEERSLLGYLFRDFKRAVVGAVE